MSVLQARKTISIALVVGLVLSIQAPVLAAGPTVTGAGSTFSEVAIKAWIGQVSAQGLTLNFQGNGSTAGRNLFIEQQVDFAVSEIPFEPEEKAQLGGLKFQYLPVVAGGTALMYHLKDKSGKRIENLRLTGEILALIFTGKLKKWNDAKIAEENPSISLPDTKVSAVVRSDGSGTSAQFSTYLRKTQPGIIGNFFSDTDANPGTSNWPNSSGEFVGQPRSDGVANFVAAEENTITYVEAAFAEIRKFPVAFIKNASGKYARPDSGNVALALTEATFNPDRSQNLDKVYSHPGAAAYPISSYSYMITPTEEKDLPVQKAEVLGKFMIYFACTGQTFADRLGYSPLPPNLVQGVFDAVKALPGPLEPPALTKEECNNPTLTGEAKPPTAPQGEDTGTAQGGGADPSPSPGGSGSGENNSQGSSNDNSGSGNSGSGNNDSGSGGSGSGSNDSGGSDSGSSPSGSGSSTTPGGIAAKKAGTTTKKAGTATPKAGTPAATKKATGTGTSGSGTTKGKTTTKSALPSGSSGSTDTSGEDVLEDSTTESGEGTVVSSDLLADIDARLQALEARAYGDPDANADLDPELRDNLLAAADDVDRGSSIWSPISLVLLMLLLFGPTLKGFAQGIRNRAGRSSRR